MAHNITLLGVLFLGAVIGFILGLALRSATDVSVKFAVTLIGSTLSGTPILFMAGLGYEMWMYPVGLIIGLLWAVALDAILTQGKQLKSTDAERWMAWMDSICIVLVMLIIVICATFGSKSD
jgi:ABC-type amino acid transport system permease subunit